MNPYQKVASGMVARRINGDGAYGRAPQGYVRAEDGSLVRPSYYKRAPFSKKFSPFPRTHLRSK